MNRFEVFAETVKMSLLLGSINWNINYEESMLISSSIDNSFSQLG